MRSILKIAWINRFVSLFVAVDYNQKSVSLFTKGNAGRFSEKIRAGAKEFKHLLNHFLNHDRDGQISKLEINRLSENKVDDSTTCVTRLPKGNMWCTFLMVVAHYLAGLITLCRTLRIMMLVLHYLLDNLTKQGVPNKRFIMVLSTDSLRTIQ